jgi:glycosyltransferase involved in cell wall biosynthesis
MERMRIMVDARPLADPASGGVKRVAVSMLRALLASGQTELVFVTTGAKKPRLPEPFDSDTNVERVHIPWPNKIWSALSVFGIVSLDREAARRCGKAFDAAILPNLGFTGYVAVPYALVLHDLSFLIEPSWFSWKMRAWHRLVNVRELARRADRLFAVSETTARDAMRLLDAPPSKIGLLHPAAALPESPETTGPNRGPYLLALGEDDRRKNIRTVIDAYHMLRRDPSFEDVSLVIAGGRPGLPDDDIERMGAVTDAELAGLYRNAAAFLYPSWYEGFGLPLHEAARYGTPCLASAHGALPETAPSGSVLIPPMKPHLWVAAMRDVLTKPGSYRTSIPPDSELPSVEGLVQWLNVTVATFQKLRSIEENH